MSELNRIIAELNAIRSDQRAIEDAEEQKRNDAERCEQEALQIAANEWVVIKPKLMKKLSLLNQELIAADVELRVTIDIESPHASIARKETVYFTDVSKNVALGHKVAFTVMSDGHTVVVISKGYMRGQAEEFKYRTAEIDALELNEVFGKFLTGAAASR